MKPERIFTKKSEAALFSVLLLVFMQFYSLVDATPRTLVCETFLTKGIPFATTVDSVIGTLADYYGSSVVCVLEYHKSGQFGTKEATERANYYGIQSLPWTLFDGVEYAFAGNHRLDSTIDCYKSLITKHLAADSPFEISLAAKPLGQDSILVKVTLKVTDYFEIFEPGIRLAVVEDSLCALGHAYRFVVRKLFEPETLSVSGVGEVQEITYRVVIDHSWNPAKIAAVAFVQDDKSHEIIQAASTYPALQKVFTLAEEIESKICEPSGQAVISAELCNRGKTADSYKVSIGKEIPEKWNVYFKTSKGIYQDSLSGLVIEKSEAENIQVFFEPGGAPGSGEVRLTVNSESNPLRSEYLRFSTITIGFGAIVVDDDGGENFEKYYKQIFSEIDTISYGVFYGPRDSLEGSRLLNFKNVIWNTGWSFPILDSRDRDIIENYLDGGGRLFISGQDLGWALCDPLSFEYSPEACNFYYKYLHSIYLRDNTGIFELDGMSGDPITDGMHIAIQGGSGAGNQVSPSQVIQKGYDSHIMLTYTGSEAWGGGVRATSGKHRTVYLSFGFEGISTDESRKELLINIYKWLTEDFMKIGKRDDSLPPVDKNSPGFVLEQNEPNPFNPETIIHFTIPENIRLCEINLSIYDLEGALVRELLKAYKPAGMYSVAWNGMDQAGRLVSCGVYFYRFRTPALSCTKKMVLLK